MTGHKGIKNEKSFVIMPWDCSTLEDNYVINPASASRELHFRSCLTLPRLRLEMHKSCMHREPGLISFSSAGLQMKKFLLIKVSGHLQTFVATYFQKTALKHTYRCIYSGEFSNVEVFLLYVKQALFQLKMHGVLGYTHLQLY